MAFDRKAAAVAIFKMTGTPVDSDDPIMDLLEFNQQILGDTALPILSEINSASAEIRDALDRIAPTINAAMNAEFKRESEKLKVEVDLARKQINEAAAGAIKDSLTKELREFRAALIAATKEVSAAHRETRRWGWGAAILGGVIAGLVVVVGSRLI